MRVVVTTDPDYRSEDALVVLIGAGTLPYED